MPPTNRIDYTQIIEKTTRLVGQDIRYITKPGLPAWESVPASAALLAEHASLPAQGKALWLGCGHGAAAAALARRFPTAHLTMLDDSHIAVQMAMRTLPANSVENFRVLEQVSSLPKAQAAFDVVLIDLPKGRRLAQRWLAEAWYALRPGGQLFLAGANDQGIQSIVKDASQLFGVGGVLDYHKGNRVVKWVKGQASACQWIHAPGVAPGTWHRLEVETPAGSLALLSLPGVFSYDKLDEGTALLLDSIQFTPDERLLDLGCGYGIIGVSAARMGAAHVDLVDSSLLAVACAQANLASHHHLAQARALASDGLSAIQDQRYDRILSNPPFHAGKGVDYQMAEAFIQQSWQALEPGGTLALVANRFIPYENILEKIFNHTSVLAETGKFKVLAGRK